MRSQPKGAVRPFLFLVAGLALLPSSLLAAPRLTELTGAVSLAREGTSAWLDAKSGDPLGNGDMVRTGPRSRAVLAFDDGSRVKLGGSTVFTVEEASRGSSAMRLQLGSLRAWVTKAAKRRFKVATPTAVCSVRGTEFSV